jgi:hypothetical protein
MFQRYRDFILIADDVHRAEDGGVQQFSVSVFDSPVGQGEFKEKVRVPATMPQLMRRLESRQLDEDLDQQIVLGEALGALLLPPRARQMFGESLARLAPDEGLRFRLRLDDALANLPWEYCWLQDSRGERTADGFLALDPRVSIVRHEAIAVPGDWFDAPTNRRVLVAMASPRPYEKYHELRSLPREQQRIREALSKVPGVDAEFVPVLSEGDDAATSGVTVGQLAAALTRRTDVFHFSGHGEFVRELTSGEGQGALIFGDAAGKAFPVSGSRLCELLRSRGIRLVVLGACEGGRRDGINIWSGVAAALLREGIPAVVAMQYTIDDGLAASFMAAFYGALVAGYLIDEAVAAGRATIRMEAMGGIRDIRDWGVPVLYLRSPSGAVFRPVNNADAAQEAARAVGLVVEQRVREVAATGRLIGSVIGTLGSGEAVTINQKVEQESKGFTVGGYVFRVEGGSLRVTQQADVVSGNTIGVVINRLGGSPSNPAMPEPDAVAELEKLLRLS